MFLNWDHMMQFAELFAVAVKLQLNSDIFSRVSHYYCDNLFVRFVLTSRIVYFLVVSANADFI